ncbi:hypothetical protein [Undibacterium aquatile]|uniref:Uncharacterized protein n=1 Tax=Undibacterium aquatile TaxID=1537398 RepID=A0ABR6XEN6_9BURK|nr:hypothetical protein [Undibacterium aquatile]MBC3811316.1 hypothetical protein [Undibacterium aquatile]
MRKQNGGSEVILLLAIGAAVIVWTISKAINLDMLLTLKEIIAISAGTAVYVLMLKYLDISFKRSFLFFVAFVILLIIPALDYYANPYAADPAWSKYITSDTAWYGSIYWQLGIIGALVAAGIWQNFSENR